MSNVIGKITIRTGGKSYDFEMHSFVKNALMMMKQEFTVNSSAGVFSKGILISTATAPSYSSTIFEIASMESTTFSCYDNQFLSGVYSKDINGAKNLTIKKVFKNISATSQTIQTVMLTVHDNQTPARCYPIIVDSVNVVVDAGQTVEVEYSLAFSKNFSEGFVKKILHAVTGAVINAVSYLGTTESVGAVFHNASTKIEVGSSDATITGNEYCLRQPVTLNASSLVVSILDPAGEDKGRIRFVGVMENTTGSSVTVNELAVTTNAVPKIFWVMKVLDSPVVLANGEMVEFTVDIILE